MLPELGVTKTLAALTRTKPRDALSTAWASLSSIAKFCDRDAVAPVNPSNVAAVPLISTLSSAALANVM